ncbi:MAG: hypothetical protein A6F71_05795 [Cycloclasticus sp. symbiont of Poecilosclerida sp. M]|nr:MAG: hypothetical protein A6F71_05795 [Cycloclasticus sp. symbiont of Poecilosclerida sp. M]
MQLTCTKIWSLYTKVVLGYSVMVQYAGSFDVVTKETRELLSPVIFDGLDGGLYSVTVFPLTDDGVIGTSVAYAVQVVWVQARYLAPATVINRCLAHPNPADYNYSY